MIFLDANVILRYLVAPSTPEIRRMAEIARALFEAVERGDEEITTAEVVLHEVAYVLAAKTHYNLPVPIVTGNLRALLCLPGFRLPRGQKRLYLHALDLWEAHPKLGFDGDFDAVPNLSRWESLRL